MFRILVTLFALNFILLLTDSVYDDGGGVQATQLTSGITAVSTTIPVESTEGFLAGNSTLIIGYETIFYTHKDATNFYTTNVNNRGYYSTDADSHADNDMVFTRITALLVNNPADYDITVTETGGGASGEASASVVSTKQNFWTDTLPQVFLWDYAIFAGQLVLIRYFLIMVSGVLSAIIALNMLPFVNFG